VALARRPGRGTRRLLRAAAAWASVTAPTSSQALRGQPVIHPDFATWSAAGAVLLVGGFAAAGL